MNDNVSDADLERFLRRRDPIARDYAALESEQPSAELDALVMERARAALSEESGPVRWRLRRWPAITALAATVVLSFAVITRITLDGNQAGLSAPVISDTVSPAAKAAEAPVEKFAVTPPASPPPAQPPSAFTRSERESSTADAVTKKDESLPTLREFTERSSAERRAPQVQDERAKQAVVVTGARQPAPAAIDGLVAAEAARRPPAPDANAPMASANAPAASTVDAREEIQSAPPAVLQKTSSQPASPASAGRSRMTNEAAGTALAGSAPQAEDEPRDPMEWLQAIRALRTAGRNEEADRELAAFRQVYPQIIEVYEVDGSGKRDSAPAEAQAQPRPPTK